MPLYLVRHAHAVPESENKQRPLSDRGCAQVRALTAFFRNNNQFTPAFVWHSPLARARQTAELLLNGLSSEAAMVEIPGLLPDDKPTTVAERINAIATAIHVAVVGHQPHLSALAAVLLENNTAPEIVDFKKAAVLTLERTPPALRKGERGTWQISWFVSAELLTPRPAPQATVSPWPK